MQKEHAILSELMNQKLLESINRTRRDLGYLTIEETLYLSERGNIVMDPFSLLISKNVQLGKNNVFYPNVILQTCKNGIIHLDAENTFFMNTSLYAEQGSIVIGSKNEFGERGCAIKANTSSSAITIGDQGRYINGPLIIGKTELGSGSQVIGAITVQDCVLKAGNPYTHPDPNTRGAVLKGNGLARNIFLAQGKVINTYGNFQDALVENQSKYHPKKI